MPRQTLRQLAYRAIERDTLSTDKETASAADQAMTELLNGTLSTKDVKHWAAREKEHRGLQAPSR